MKFQASELRTEKALMIRINRIVPGFFSLSRFSNSLPEFFRVSKYSKSIQNNISAGEEGVILPPSILRFINNVK